ncbi:MAG: RNA polymerase subunit sigma [Candidatus Omnitrophica bacterium]|nr:RNA polymerase subunit sigma [Candidatus Omnitrophota bacterium]
MDFNQIDEQARQCAKLIKNAKTIAALTGAGISTNAGIPDFRGERGLYVTKQYDAEKIFDINYFSRDAKPFYDFARDFVNLTENIKPTRSHYFLAELEKTQKFLGVITQNIDSLHQQAGSSNVYEMHGSFQKSFCHECGKMFILSILRQRMMSEIVPLCDCGGVLKPDIVFFGELVKHYKEAIELTEKADLFFIIGTSCVVHPAAQIPSHASGDIVIVNQGKVEFDLYNISLKVNGDADEFFEKVAFFI